MSQQYEIKPLEGIIGQYRGIVILTGFKVATLNEYGEYEKGSLNYMIMDRLKDIEDDHVDFDKKLGKL